MAVKPTDNVEVLLKAFEDKMYQGYTYKERVVKDSSGKPIDLISIPTSDFTVELHYEGSLVSDQLLLMKRE